MNNKNTKNIGGVLLRLAQGLLVGSSGILPGISGGVFCVVFGIYKPLMEILASPFKKIKEYWQLLLPFGIGALLGFLIIAKVLGAVMENYGQYATCLFLGLIVGTFPSLFKTAAEKKRTASSYVALAVSFVLVFSLFMYLEYGVSFSAPHNMLSYMLAGVVFGISIVLPGLSAYAILESLGLITPMLNAVGDIDIAVLLPIGIGCAVALISLSKLISMLYEKHFSVMSHIIIGVVIATTIPLVPSQFGGILDVVVMAALAIVGFIIATVFAYIEEKLKV